MTDAQVPGSPEDPRGVPAYVGGEAGKRLAAAFRRWRASGYDSRLAPEANPSPEVQAAYDAFDRGDWDA